jgi:hypothetical protein
MNDLATLTAQAYTTPGETRPTLVFLHFVHDWKKFFDSVLLPL